MRDSAEIGIVGAGPAGARAAELLAARGADVVVLDPRVPWEKPCGGGLTPTLFDEMPELEEIRPLTRPVGLVRVEMGNDIGFEVEIERPICIVSRTDLGRWQLDRALAAGASHVAAQVRDITRARGGWLLDTEQGSLAVATLVGADGAASIVRRSAACGLRLEPLAARVEYPREEGPFPATLVLRFYPGRVGYLWDFPRLHERSVGMEVASGSASRTLVDSALDEYLGSTLDGGGARARARVGAIIGSAPLRPGRFARMAGDDFALLGDAAGLADPFTGEGIRNALRSATLLAAAYASGERDWTRRYARSARREFATEIAVAALLRRVLSESRVGAALVERAPTSDGSYAFVAATLDALSAHDYRPISFIRRWLERRRGGRRLHDAATSRYGQRVTTSGGHV